MAYFDLEAIKLQANDELRAARVKFDVDLRLRLEELFLVDDPDDNDA